MGFTATKSNVIAALHADVSCCAVLRCAEAHNNLGVLQRDVGAIPDALSSYERALQLVPDSRNAGGCLFGQPGHVTWQWFAV